MSNAKIPMTNWSHMIFADPKDHIGGDGVRPEFLIWVLSFDIFLDFGFGHLSFLGHGQCLAF